MGCQGAPSPGQLLFRPWLWSEVDLEAWSLALDILRLEILTGKSKDWELLRTVQILKNRGIFHFVLCLVLWWALGHRGLNPVPALGALTVWRQYGVGDWWGPRVRTVLCYKRGMCEALGTEKRAANPAWCYSRGWVGEQTKGRESSFQKGTPELGLEK